MLDISDFFLYYTIIQKSTQFLFLQANGHFYNYIITQYKCLVVSDDAGKDINFSGSVFENISIGLPVDVAS